MIMKERRDVDRLFPPRNSGRRLHQYHTDYQATECDISCYPHSITKPDFRNELTEFSNKTAVSKICLSSTREMSLLED